MNSKLTFQLEIETNSTYVPLWQTKTSCCKVGDVTERL